ncbi:MAG: RNase adapter RapZ [Ruminococcaceae bacterium]|nr:RNase adapter RapZ [Oscillospiraceae bacterium]
MDLIIVTGLSGAGKSGVINILEDIDFVCVDNLTPELIPAFGQILKKGDQEKKTAIVTDVRAGAGFKVLQPALEELTKMGIDYKIIFMDADDKTLQNRYKEKRRKHPLSAKYPKIADAIKAERKALEPIRQLADIQIDTTDTTLKQLKDRVVSMFFENLKQAMTIQVRSFGFKYGGQSDADLVFDVRCLPNPFYVGEFKNKTGLDREVRDYVMNSKHSVELLNKIEDLIGFLVPLYIEEGKTELIIAFGCTGGKHRSVTFAEEIYSFLKEKDLRVTVIHVDILK